MPRIDADLKLDFKDVLLRPKRSSLKSRAEVGPFESRIGAGLFFFFSGVARGRWVRGAVLCAHLTCFFVCLGVGGTPTPSALLTTVERESQLVPCQDRRCL